VHPSHTGHVTCTPARYDVMALSASVGRLLQLQMDVAGDAVRAVAAAPSSTVELCHVQSQHTCYVQATGRHRKLIAGTCSLHNPIDRGRPFLYKPTRSGYCILCSTNSSKFTKTTRSSADAEGPRHAPQIRNMALEKACNREMTFKNTQVHYSCSY